MPWLRPIWFRCQALVMKERLDREFDEEVHAQLFGEGLARVSTPS